MKAIVLGLFLALASTPALASKNSERHKHMRELHKEHKIVAKWMTKAESDCAHDADFHSCYVKSIKDQRASHPKFSPETEKMLNNLTKNRRTS